MERPTSSFIVFLSVLFLTIAISNLQDFSFKIETDKEQHVHQKPKKIANNETKDLPKKTEQIRPVQNISAQPQENTKLVDGAWWQHSVDFLACHGPRLLHTTF